MPLYFCGLDQFNCILEHKQGESFQCEKQPLKIEGIARIVMGISLCAYQKVGAGSTWYLKGLGLSNESTLFSDTLNISEVKITSECIVGYNKVDSILYNVKFEVDAFDNLTWDVNKVPKGDPAIQIIQIVSNDDKVYGLDDCSGVYEVNNDGFVLKWRMEGVQWIKLGCAFGHFVALSDTGALYSWGNGGRGELGQMDNDHLMVNCEVPKRIDFFDDLPSIVKDISCGGWHTLVLTSDGDVYSWGWNESGQLGHSKEKLSAILGQPYPIDLGSAEDPIVSIAAGARHSLVLLKSGKIFSWGVNKHGQLGLGDLDNRQEPEEIKFNFSGKPARIECGRWCSFIYTE